MNIKIILILILALAVSVFSANAQEKKSKGPQKSQPTTPEGIRVKKEQDELRLKLTTLQERIKPLNDELLRLNQLIAAKQQAKQSVSVEVTRRKQLQDQVNPLRKTASELSSQIAVKQAQINLAEGRK